MNDHTNLTNDDEGNVGLVRRHLERFGTLTNWEAFTTYHIMHVAEYVRRLRRRGMTITMTMETGEKGKRFGRYRYTAPALLLLALVAGACSQQPTAPVPAAWARLGEPLGRSAAPRPLPPGGDTLRAVCVIVSPLAEAVSVRVGDAHTCRWVSAGETAALAVGRRDTLHLHGAFSGGRRDTLLVGDTMRVGWL